MAIKDRLIQFILRARDELSPEAKKAGQAIDTLSREAETLGRALDSAKEARGLAKAMQAAGAEAERAQRDLERARERADALQKELSQNPGSKGLNESLRAAEREAARASRELSRVEQQLAELEKSAKAAGIDTRNLSAEERRLADDVESVRKALDDANGRLKEAQRQQAAAARAASEHASRMESVRGAMSRGAKQILAFAAAYISLNAAFGLVQRGLNSLAAGIRSMLETGDRFELLGKRMASLMGSVAEGERATAWIKQFARDTPMDIEGVTEAFALLKSYGLDPMGGALQAIVDKNEQLGGGMERLSGLAAALGQAWAKQKLQTEEILQLVERGVPVWSLLEKITGKTAAQLATLASQGRLGRDVIAALIKEIGDSAKGAAAENMGTLTGLVSNLSDAWTDFLGRVAKSGALDYVKKQLASVADYIEQMDRDGRLDKLAQSLSKAFEQGSEKAKEFLGRLVDIDFNKLIEDSSAFFNEFGSKIDSAAQRVQLFFAPFRTLFNGLTAGLSGMGAAFTGTVGLMLGAVEEVANKVPDMLGGEKIRASVKSAREAINGLRDGFVAQIEQDGQDIRDAWDTTTQSAVKNAQAQQDAAKAAEQAKVDAAQATADKLNELNAQFAQRALEAAVTGQRAIADMADALNLIDTAKSREQLEGLRKALLKAYQDGRLSIDEYQQATGVLNGRLKELGHAAGGAAELVSDLDDALGDLQSVQQAISNARTDVDINNIRAALRKLYSDGQITAAQYNEELKRVSERQKELKSSVERTAKAGRDAGEQLTRAQQMYNDALEDGILTNEELRRISGQRMEEERRASGEAMERHRKGVDATQRDLSAMESFFSGVMSRAREPLAAMSAAALRFYDQIRGIANAEIRIDHSNLDATRRSLEQVSERLAEIQAELGNPMTSALGRWALETQRASLATQQAFLAQKAHLQSLMRDYESGRMSARRFVESATAAKRAMGLLDESDLSSLESAIQAAQQRMEQMASSTRSTLESLQDELDQLQGRTEDIERRRFAARRRELEAQLAEAQAGGDAQAVANAARALGMLRQIEAETEQKRLADQQKARQEELARAKETTSAPKASEPSKIIRLEVPGRQAVEVGVNSAEDETRLLDVLEAAGLRSL